jgi:succinoglycan biosynthesis protein ExoA
MVSVIMPVRNEESFIRRSLGALLRQTYPAELLEIIVADGMSTDRTRDVIGLIKYETRIPIKVVDNPARIAPSGLNRAVAAARGEIIVRVDGHCEIEPDYIEHCVRHLQDGKADGVGGPIETIGETLPAQAIAAAMSSKFGVGGSAFRTTRGREMYVDTVAFPGYRRETLERAGAFNEELVRNQDDEYNYRIRKAGGRILLTPDIRSRYYSRSSLGSLWRQYFQYGYWKIRVLQLHPKQMSLRQFVPFAFVSALILFGSLSIFSVYARWGLLLIAGTYLAAAFAAAFKTALEMKRPAALPYVFAGFIILHLSYGLGFLTGLFAFAGRWREKERNAKFAGVPAE